MLIACPNCSTSYKIDPASLGEAGRTVRCARCKTKWFAAGAKSGTCPASAEGATAEEEWQAAKGVLLPDRAMADSDNSEPVDPIGRAANSGRSPPIPHPQTPPRGAGRCNRCASACTGHRNHRHLRTQRRRQRIRKKLKISPPAASECRLNATKHADLRAGRLLCSSCSRSTWRWWAPGARS